MKFTINRLNTVVLTTLCNISQEELEAIAESLGDIYTSDKYTELGNGLYADRIDSCSIHGEYMFRVHSKDYHFRIIRSI